jgi:hypothetical protein
VWPNIGSTHAHARLRCQQAGFFFDAIEVPFGSGGLLKPDPHINFQ